MSEEERATKNKLRPATLVTQAGRAPFEHFGFVNPPVYRGSTVLFPTIAALEGLRQPYTYGTKGTPTTRALEQAWSEIAGGADTVLTPSGLAAIGLALLTATHAGAHALIADSAYQPTRNFCDGLLTRFGVTVEYYDPLIGGAIAAMMRPETTAVLVESPGSQSMEVQDIPAIAAAAHAHGACVIADNTWATPLLFPAARTRLRPRGRSRHQISRGSRRSSHRPRFRQRQMGEAPAGDLQRLRHGLQSRRRIARAARAAHDGAAPARTGARSARHRAMAGGPAGSFARPASRPSDASRP